MPGLVWCGGSAVISSAINLSLSLEHTDLTGTRMQFRRLPAIMATSPEIRFIWAHGWGLSGISCYDAALAAASLGESVLPDFPGFGDSPPPPADWGSVDYADALIPWLEQSEAPGRRLIWIGHSFGGRLGIQIGIRRPELLAGMVLIAAAGLPRRLRPAERLRRTALRLAYRTARNLTPEGQLRDRVRNYFGSPDYRTAGAMRGTLTRIVNEDLSSAAAQLRIPTRLLYGALDTETPPEIGQRYSQLIPGAELTVLRDFDHHNILTRGRHQIAHTLRHLIREFL